jgi:hypothetical protein
MAIDLEQSSETPANEPERASEVFSDSIAQERTDPDALDAMRERLVAAAQRRFGVALIRRRRALYESVDGRKRACITISKRYERDSQPYWYGYQRAWHDFLNQGEDSMLVFGCMDRDEAFVIPVGVVVSFLPKLNQTIREGGASYWHIVFTTNEDGSLALYSSRTGEKLDLSLYSVPLGR